jgi:anti-sigma B factor antagonist
MTYMTCPSCGFGVNRWAAPLALDRCPRCLAKGTEIEMRVSERLGPWRQDGSGEAHGDRGARRAAARHEDPTGGPSDRRWSGIDFSITSERWGIAHRIAVFGELDLATSPQLEQELIRVEQTGVSLIELDLAGLTFVDSAGVHVLARADARAQLSGSGLIVKPGGRAVQRVLALVGVAGVAQLLPWVSAVSAAPGAPSESRGRRTPAGVQMPRTVRPSSGFVTDWSR